MRRIIAVVALVLVCAGCRPAELYPWPRGRGPEHVYVPDLEFQPHEDAP